MPGSLLVNFVYCHPVGHAIEALHAAHGYHRADPDLRISVALHADTALDLVTLCPFVDTVYPIRVDFFDGSADLTSVLAPVPRAWDCVLDSWHGTAGFPGLAAYYEQARRHVAPSGRHGIAGAQPPAYSAGEPFRLRFPADVSARAVGPGGPRIAVLPGGGGGLGRYPSVRSWLLILRTLRARWPDARFCFVGKYQRDGRTTTGFTAEDLARLAAEVPGAVPAVDIPLVEQLATVAACDVLISPHSGFGMAALAAGTPWLSIAGNAWPEYYFNGTPFYSVLPDLDRFPCYTESGPEPEPVADDGRRTPSMSHQRIVADLDEIVTGAAHLIDGPWDFDTAMTDHVRRMLVLRGGDADRIWSIDHVHRRYLPSS
jgi:hypothetical protein